MSNNMGVILDKIRHNTANIGENFFIDYKTKKAGDKKIPYWNVAMLTFAYALKKNALLIGEPGFGKTTASKVIGSVYGGYPFDMFESAQFQGHPEQTVESLVGRLDFSKLAKEEKVIWQIGMYLPMILLDEINRLPGGKQDVMLNGIETGRFSYLNDTFFDDKKPFFATANHPDDGNHIIIPPMADRFAVCLEMGDQGPYAQKKISVARRNIAECLCDYALTDKLLGIINSTSSDVNSKLRKIANERQSFLETLAEKAEMKFVSEKEMEALKDAVEAVPLSAEASVFLDCVQAELNYGGKYGRKRSCDAIDSSDHMKNIASSKVKNAFSPRGMDSVKIFAQAVALYIGSKQVEKAHLTAVAPYVMQHRLDFTDDFRAENEIASSYGEEEIYYNAPTVNEFLAQKLIEGVDANYMAAVHNNVSIVSKLIAGSYGMSDDEKKKAKNMLEGKLSSLDHPLLKCLAYEWNRRR